MQIENWTERKLPGYLHALTSKKNTTSSSSVHLVQEKVTAAVGNIRRKRAFRRYLLQGNKLVSRRSDSRTGQTRPKKGSMTTGILAL